MPTLIRLVVWIAVLAGIGFGSMQALVMLVKNEPTEISERVRLDDLRIE